MGMPDIRIVTMGAQRFAYVHEFGTRSGEMERTASAKLRRWAKAEGLLDAPRGFHYFGANDPPPVKDGDRYGYFSGMTVPAGTKASGEVKVRDIAPATYAVLRFKGLYRIGEMWQTLYGWAEKSREWKVAGHGLEEILAPLEGEVVDAEPERMVFDLWLPVEKK